MTLKEFKYTVISILLHGVFICVFVSLTLPYPKQEVKKKAIESYLFFDNLTAMPKPVNNSIDTQDEIKVVDKIEVPTENNIPEIIKSKTKSVEITSLDIIKPTPPDVAASISSGNVQAAVSKYIQNLDSKEISRISESSLNEFRRLKPLIDKSIPLSNNQRLKALSSNFAPKGSDIIVLSEFGPDETTIKLGDSCFNITQTALDDKVWKGSSRWTKSNGCGKYDKFDGQLQRSLNKYLRK